MQSKIILLLLAGSLFLNTVNGQISGCVVVPAPKHHQPNAPDCYDAINPYLHNKSIYMSQSHELCDPHDGYIRMFEENFNGTEVNEKVWFYTFDEGWFKNSKESGDGSDITIFWNKDPNIYQVNNGELRINSFPFPNSPYVNRYKAWGENGCDTVSEEIPYQQKSGQIATRRMYPTGNYQVRAYVHYSGINVNNAPLWLFYPYSGGDTCKDNNGVPTGTINDLYYYEIDIELWHKKVDRLFPWIRGNWWTLNYGPSLANPHGVCIDGLNNRCDPANHLFNDWHNFDIEWDKWRVKWSVDGEHFRTVYSFYEPLTGLPIDECDWQGSGDPTVYVRRHKMFPAYANMRMVSDIAIGETEDDTSWIWTLNSPHMKLDYIRADKKIFCDKFVQLNEFKPIYIQRDATGYITDIATTEETFTPQVITGGVINVAGNGNSVIIKRDPSYKWEAAHLDLYASTSITMNPGFLADPSLSFYPSYICQPDSIEIAHHNQEVADADIFLAQAVQCPTFPVASTKKEPDKITDLALIPNRENLELVVEEPEQAYPDSTTIRSKSYGSMNRELAGIIMGVFPNPAESGRFIHIMFSLPEEGIVELSLHSLQGEKLMSIDKSYRLATNHTITINNLKLSAGTYFVRLTCNGISKTERFIII